MVHAFAYPFKGRLYRFIWDNESGSLHNVDANAFLVAKESFTSQPLTKDEKTELDNIPKSIKTEILEEFQQLIARGLFLSKPVTEQRQKGFGTLKAMCLLVCYDCNMKCEYCFAEEGTYSSQRCSMSLDIGKKSVDYLIRHSGKRKNIEIDFFGGEPILNINVVKEVVRYAREQEKKHNKQFYFTLTTNALSLTDDVIDFINKEMDNVVLSIDGREEVHNNLRKSSNNKDTHSIVLRNIKKLISKRGDKSYYVRGTFTSKNLDFASDVLYLANQGFKQISLEPVVTDIKSICITKDHIETINKEYEKLAYEYIKLRQDDKTWFNFFHFMVDLDKGPCITKRMTGCGAGCEYVSVSPQGDIFPCHQFSEDKRVLLGNVSDIDNFNLEISKDFSYNVVTNKKECQDCFAKYYCSGGCCASNYTHNHDINKPYDITCEMMKKRFELALFINAIEKSAF